MIRKEELIQCPLCGFRFPKGHQKECRGCPLGGSRCRNVLCCPNCGYGFIETSALVEWLRRLFRRRRNETQT